MTQKVKLALFIGRWCVEALATCGDDWPLIEAYMRAKLLELDDGQRAELEAEAQVVLDAKAHGFYVGGKH
jgi:hypothetical protein